MFIALNVWSHSEIKCHKQVLLSFLYAVYSLILIFFLYIFTHFFCIKQSYTQVHSILKLKLLSAEHIYLFEILYAANIFDVQIICDFSIFFFFL